MNHSEVSRRISQAVQRDLTATPALVRLGADKLADAMFRAINGEAHYFPSLRAAVQNLRARDIGMGGADQDAASKASLGQVDIGSAIASAIGAAATAAAGLYSAKIVSAANQKIQSSQLQQQAMALRSQELQLQAIQAQKSQGSQYSDGGSVVPGVPNWALGVGAAAITALGITLVALRR